MLYLDFFLIQVRLFIYNPKYNCTIERKVAVWDIARWYHSYRNYFPKLTSNWKSGKLLYSFSFLVAIIHSGPFLFHPVINLSVIS